MVWLLAHPPRRWAYRSGMLSISMTDAAVCPYGIIRTYRRIFLFRPIRPNPDLFCCHDVVPFEYFREFYVKEGKRLKGKNKGKLFTPIVPVQWDAGRGGLCGHYTPKSAMQAP